jgi:hypothetical protein
VIGVVLCAAKGVDGGAKVVSRWPTGLPRPIRHRPGKSTAVVARPGATRRATRLCQRGPQAWPSVRHDTADFISCWASLKNPVRLAFQPSSQPGHRSRDDEDATTNSMEEAEVANRRGRRCHDNCHCQNRDREKAMAAGWRSCEWD